MGTLSNLTTVNIRASQDPGQISSRPCPSPEIDDKIQVIARRDKTVHLWAYCLVSIHKVDSSRVIYYALQFSDIFKLNIRKYLLEVIRLTIFKSSNIWLVRWNRRQIFINAYWSRANHWQPLVFWKANQSNLSVGKIGPRGTLYSSKHIISETRI